MGISMSNWISVKDRLPEDYGTYIVCLANGTVFEMTFSNIGATRWFKVNICDEYQGNPVTHWMPFPEPPKVHNEKQPRGNREFGLFEYRLVMR